MSVRDMNKKLYIKSKISPTPECVRIDETDCTVTLPLWQINLLLSVLENITNDYSCEVFYGFNDKI